jgi:hypothetical protein
MEMCDRGEIVHLLVVGFHHKKGHQVIEERREEKRDSSSRRSLQIEYSFPRLIDPLDARWSTLSSLALPDGIHRRDDDLIYFNLPDLNEDRTIFGVAAYRQIDANVRLSLFSGVDRHLLSLSVRH